jgi:hypothetical protein
MISMAIASQAGQDSAKIDEGTMSLAGSIMPEYVSWKVGGILKGMFEPRVVIYGTMGRGPLALRSLIVTVRKSPITRTETPFSFLLSMTEE